MYELTDEQLDMLSEYFELALTAISDDEQTRLVGMELPIRNMLRGIRSTPRP